VSQQQQAVQKDSKPVKKKRERFNEKLPDDVVSRKSGFTGGVG